MLPKSNFKWSRSWSYVYSVIYSYFINSNCIKYIQNIKFKFLKIFLNTIVFFIQLCFLHHFSSNIFNILNSKGWTTRTLTESFGQTRHGFAYHYSFHYLISLWSGIHLHHIFLLRWWIIYSLRLELYSLCLGIIISFTC